MRPSFTLVLFKAVCHANPGMEGKLAWLSPYISKVISRAYDKSCAINKFYSVRYGFCNFFPF